MSRRGKDDAMEAARARFVAGDFKEARRLAWAVAGDPGAGEEARRDASLLRERTEIDGRALLIAAIALALAAIFVTVVMTR
jgi:hypothetical protein